GAGAYIWADQPSAMSYQPASFYNWNSSGVANSVAHGGAGVYKVTLPSSDTSGGSFEVTAYGLGPEHCKLQNWVPSADGKGVVATVLCFDATGSPLDTRFSLHYLQNHSVRIFDAGGYAWGDNPTASSYTPSPSFAFDSPNTKCAAQGVSAGRISNPGKYFMKF